MVIGLYACSYARSFVSLSFDQTQTQLACSSHLLGMGELLCIALMFCNLQTNRHVVLHFFFPSLIPINTPSFPSIRLQPIAAACAGVWLVLMPFEGCFRFVRDITDFLEKIITWPRDCGRAIGDCSTRCPTPF